MAHAWNRKHMSVGDEYTMSIPHGWYTIPDGLTNWSCLFGAGVDTNSTALNRFG